MKVRNGLVLGLLWLGLCVSISNVVRGQSGGTVVAWGLNNWGQCNVPEPNEGFVAVAAFGDQSLGLKSDGRIVGWGYNSAGQLSVPEPNRDFVAIATGASHCLGLKSDGTIVAWGTYGWGRNNVPEPNEGFVAVSDGGFHCLGLKSDGTIIAWGWNYDGQLNVPAPNRDFIAVAAGVFHSLGLKSDGTIVAWGYNRYDQLHVPAPNKDFIAVAAGGSSLGLKSDGTIVDWPASNIPAPNEGFVAIALGESIGVGLKSDGTIVAWGNNDNGELNVPAPNKDFIAVAAGRNHGLVLRMAHKPVVQSLDIKPGACPNPFNLKEDGSQGKGDGHGNAGGVLPVAILGAADFDVSTIDTSAVLFMGAEPLRYAYEDVGGPSASDEDCACRAEGKDGRTDIVFKFSSAAVSQAIGTASRGDVVKLTLKGALEDGTFFEASDCVTIVGGGKPEGVAAMESKEVALRAAMPNPFNPITSISYYLPSESYVELTVYDVVGRLVERLVAEVEPAGERVVQWNADSAPSGIYFYRLTVGAFQETRKMVLLK